MSTNQTDRPFGLRDKIGYAMGDFGNNFTFLFATMYLMTFCTDVLNIPGVVVGVILSASKIVDAFTDFFMGRICDTAKPTKDGRFRPWIKRMAIPMGISSMLIYQYWVSGFSYGARVAWVAVFYIIWGSFFYTACAIPYGSMASVITNVSKERTQLSTYRTIGATLSGMLIGIIAPMLIFGKSKTGQQIVIPEKFTVTAVIFGIFSALFYLLCYKMSTERVQIEPGRASGKSSLSVGETLKNLVTCRPLLAIIVVALLTLVASLGTSALNTYLYKDYFNDTSVMPIAMTASTLSMICMAPVASKLAAKFGKKEVGAAGILLSTIVLFITWVARITNPMVYVVLFTLQNMAMALNSMVTWAYIGDVIDYQEVKSGIYNCMTLLPAILYLAAFLIMAFLYPLGKKQVDENAHILEERHGAQ